MVILVVTSVFQYQEEFRGDLNLKIKIHYS